MYKTKTKHSKPSSKLLTPITVDREKSKSSSTTHAKANKRAKESKASSTTTQAIVGIEEKKSSPTQQKTDSKDFYFFLLEEILNDLQSWLMITETMSTITSASHLADAYKKSLLYQLLEEVWNDSSPFTINDVVQMLIQLDRIDKTKISNVSLKVEKCIAILQKYSAIWDGDATRALWLTIADTSTFRKLQSHYGIDDSHLIKFVASLQSLPFYGYRKSIKLIESYTEDNYFVPVLNLLKKKDKLERSSYTFKLSDCCLKYFTTNIKNATKDLTHPLLGSIIIQKLLPPVQAMNKLKENTEKLKLFYLEEMLRHADLIEYESAQYIIGYQIKKALNQEVKIDIKAEDLKILRFVINSSQKYFLIEEDNPRLKSAVMKSAKQKQKLKIYPYLYYSLRKNVEIILIYPFAHLAKKLNENVMRVAIEKFSYRQKKEYQKELALTLRAVYIESIKHFNDQWIVCNEIEFKDASIKVISHQGFADFYDTLNTLQDSSQSSSDNPSIPVKKIQQQKSDPTGVSLITQTCIKQLKEFENTDEYYQNVLLAMSHSKGLVKGTSSNPSIKKVVIQYEKALWLLKQILIKVKDDSSKVYAMLEIILKGIKKEFAHTAINKEFNTTVKFKLSEVLDCKIFHSYMTYPNCKFMLVDLVDLKSHQVRDEFKQDVRNGIYVLIIKKSDEPLSYEYGFPDPKLDYVTAKISNPETIAYLESQRFAMIESDDSRLMGYFKRDVNPESVCGEISIKQFVEILGKTDVFNKLLQQVLLGPNQPKTTTVRKKRKMPEGQRSKHELALTPHIPRTNKNGFFPTLPIHGKGKLPSDGKGKSPRQGA